MSDNGMTTLRCGIEDHGDMDRLFEDHRPLTAAFSLWICQGCGTMAVHLEVPGDIYWYKAEAKTRWTTHLAGCAYCPTRFDCSCDTPGSRHMCPGCDAAAEESKMGVGLDPAEETRSVHIFPQGLHRDPIDDPDDPRQGPF